MERIGKKILQVMCECGVIIKDGYNQEGDFTFVSAFSVVTKVREAFIKNGIIPEPELFLEHFEKITNKSGDQAFLAVVKSKIRLIDTDSGESIATEGFGSAIAASDKVVMMAETAAVKYAYLHGLGIPTKDDPERSNQSESFFQQKQKANQSNKNNMEVVKKYSYNKAVCCDCGTVVSDKVRKYSVEKYGSVFCMKCQAYHTQAV
ncbi:MAG TPA: ERF family protein [Phascolarctobacterium faecium]|mgnify:FL=1|jgi:hypothetical protein|uniref:ERF family protein n=1 Tax=Phascolarctobacterium faecium TaxID=33025 RepID=UPI00242A5B4A|nr:ERF family protein [Phascolarctobacterium faecium]HJI09618.1 ERF family protein [Phascolarctobacterium faecium]